MKHCEICGKGYKPAQTLKKLRGKYNPTSKIRKYPNLQWVVIPKDAKHPKKAVPLRGKRLLACAKCIKALGKKK